MDTPHDTPERDGRLVFIEPADTTPLTPDERATLQTAFAALLRSRPPSPPCCAPAAPCSPPRPPARSPAPSTRTTPASTTACAPSSTARCRRVPTTREGRAHDRAHPSAHQAPATVRPGARGAPLGPRSRRTGAAWTCAPSSGVRNAVSDAKT